MPQLGLFFLAVQFHHLPLHRLRRFAVRPSPSQPMPQCPIASRAPAYQQGPHPAHAKPQLRRCLLLGYVPTFDLVQNLEPVPLLCRHPQPLFPFRHVSIKAELSTLRKEELLTLRLQQVLSLLTIWGARAETSAAT